MLAIHRIFQMIFGIIVSVTILYFLIVYSGQYKQNQEDFQKALILKAFADEAKSVYLTGISTNFTQFYKYDFSSCFIKPQTKSLPEMQCMGTGIADVPVDTPLIFYPGKQVYISRGSLDYGWWVYNFAEAMPSITFVFNPEGSQEEKDVITSIVQLIPDTTDDWSVVKVGFAICDGGSLSNCGDQPCSKDDILSIISSWEAKTKCTASLKKSMKLVTVSRSCGSFMPQSGVCIGYPNTYGVGNAYIQGSGKEYVWKDPLDLVALSLGGSEKDEFGKTAGEKLYEIKNSALMARLSLAADITSRRIELILRSISPDNPCYASYVSLVNELSGIGGKDYTDLSQMDGLNQHLNAAKAYFQSLEEAGCERSMYGA